MKGLESVPNISNLRVAYDHLQSAKMLLNPPQIALYSQWARLDPRLAEILVGHFTVFWQEIAVGSLIQALTQQPWPRSIAVLLRFAVLGLATADREVARHLISAVETAFPAPPPQLYFVPLQVPNSVILREEVDFRIDPYFQSGYIGSQPLFQHSKPPANRTFLSAIQRKQILSDLFAKQNFVTVSDHIYACKGMVSRRQAQRDLNAYSGVKAQGFTRGRSYTHRSKSLSEK